jgi:nucleoid-associated protein YgaU
MSKTALYLGLAGTGTAVAVTALVMTGIIEMPGRTAPSAPAPEATTDAPDAPSAPLVANGDAPLVAEPVLVPADPAPAETAVTPAPADPAPAETAVAPAPADAAPAETAVAPAPADPAPAETAVAPVPSDPAPAETAVAPAPADAAPAETAVAPAPADPAPAETAEAPAPADPAPAETAVAPAPAESATATAPAESGTSADPLTAEPVEPAQTALLPLFDPAATTSVAEPLLDGDVILSRPSFDTVRTERDGFSLIAGEGEPGSTLEVLVDGEPAETVEVGRDGKFSTFLNLPPDQAAVISLRMTKDETIVLSEDEVIVAPLELAAAEVTPIPQPGATSPAETLFEAQPDAATAPRLPQPVLPQGDAIALADPGGVPAAGAVGRDALPEQTPEAVPNVASPDTAVPDAAQVAAAPAPDPGAVPEVEVSSAPLPEAGPPPAEPRAADVTSAPVVPESQPAPEIVAATEPGLSPEVAGAAPGVGAALSAPPVVSSIDPGALAAPDLAAPDLADGTSRGPITAEDPIVVARAQPDVAPEPVAPRAPAVLLSTPRGVEALSVAPISPGDVALDSISYDDAGDVLLSGRGTNAAFVRIYLDNTPVTTSRIRDDGRWRVQLPEVDTGTYTLRVDQIDARGQVLARVESPFLRESAAVLERAVTSGGGRVNSVTIQPGNTLWGISRERYGDGMQYVKIYDANRERIRDPDLIYPGQIFDLPAPAQD